MEYLLTLKNLKVLESFTIVNTLYAFDYDGTLAAITDDPAKAYMSEKVSELLLKLSKRSSIAIITGRSSDDVKKFLNFEPDYIIGNHGIEGCHPEDELQEMSKKVSLWKSMLGELPPDVYLEDKKYSLCLHFRKDISPLMPFLEQLPEATLIHGKSIINIVPSGGMNKGQALHHIMKLGKFHFGFFAGDDVTDENVFAYKNSRLFLRLKSVKIRRPSPSITSSHSLR